MISLSDDKNRPVTTLRLLKYARRLVWVTRSSPPGVSGLRSGPGGVWIFHRDSKEGVARGLTPASVRRDTWRLRDKVFPELCINLLIYLLTYFGPHSHVKRKEFREGQWRFGSFYRIRRSVGAKWYAHEPPRVVPCWAGLTWHRWFSLPSVSRQGSPEVLIDPPPWDHLWTWGTKEYPPLKPVEREPCVTFFLLECWDPSVFVEPIVPRTVCHWRFIYLRKI